MGIVVASSSIASGRTVLLAQNMTNPGEVDPWAGVEEMVTYGSGGLAVGDFADADSVVAFGAEDLLAVGAQDISDLADFTPNLEIVNSGATTPTFFIRGVGLNDFNSNSTGAVAIYSDGVAVNAPALQLSTLFDVEGVTILRGPQGVGLNRNASAGTIKIRSRRPTGEVGGYLRADFGNYDSMDYEGAIEAPIVPGKAAARLAFRFTRRDGTMTNRCAGAPPLNQRVPYTGQAQFRGIGDWSWCGEAQPFITPGDISDIPVGLEKDVNDRHNWAARATFTFDPDTDLVPMSWTLNIHGSRRDELTRLGQSAGTGGFFCIDGDICSAPFFGIPPEDRGTQTTGLFGGLQGRTGQDYQPRETFERLGELSPCSVEKLGNVLGTCRFQGTAARENENQAKIQVAKELARELDDEPYEGDFNRTGDTTNTVLGGFLEGQFDWTNEIDVTTVTAFDYYDRSIDNDADFSPETLFHIKTTDDGYQFYQDINITGDFVDFDNPFSWDLSGWFLYERLSVDVTNDLGRDASIGVGSRRYSQRGWSTGASLDVGVDFFEDFRLDGGVRYNWDRKDLDYTLFPGEAVLTGNELTNLDETWEAATGTIRLTYNFREDTHVFGKYTRGWKPGTINATSGQGRPVTVADPEEIDSFEIGLEGAWFEDRILLRGQLFYYAYADYQIFTTQQLLGGNTEFVTLNAEDAEVYGAEAEFTARPFEYTELGVNFSWLESQFLDFVQVNQNIAVGGVFFQEVQNSGNQLLNSPRFKVILRAIQTIPIGLMGTLSFRYDGVWTDDTYFDASEGLGTPNLFGDRYFPEYAVGQTAYWIHNIRVGWTSIDGQLDAAFWMRNIADEAYKTYAFDASAFQNSTVQFLGDPRTYGVSFTVNF